MKNNKILLISIVILALMTTGTISACNMTKGKNTGGNSSAKKGVTSEKKTTGQGAAQQQNLDGTSNRSTTSAIVTEEQILNAAKSYFKSVNPGNAVPKARIDSTTDETWFIQLYEDMGDHTATYDWYTINKKTLDGTDNFGDHISLSGYISNPSTNKDISDTPVSGNSSNNNGNVGNNTQNSSKDRFVLEPNTYIVGNKKGQIPPGRYGIKTEGNRQKYYGYLGIFSAYGGDQHHYSFGMAEGNDELFNRGALDLDLKEGDKIQFRKDVGDFTLTLYRK